jgi:long-subunit fatty acid transport protein
MIKLLKLTMFIVRLPLSVFLYFRGKRYNLQRSSHLRIMLCFVMCIVVAASQFLNPPQAEGAFMEQIAIDTKAISLANTVTADPPGIMSIHYNPAGLSLMGEGNFITLGAIVPLMKYSSKFDADPNFKGYHNFDGTVQKDSLAGTEGTNASGQMYIPGLDKTLDFLIVPTFGLSHRSPGSKWTFGYSAYVPYGGGWRQGGDNPARFDGQDLYLQHMIYAAPSVSYRINKTLSIGASFGLGQTAMGVNTTVRAPNELTNITKVLGDATQGMTNPIFDLTIPMPLFGGGLGPYDEIGNLSFNIRDDFSPSFNVGALWEPFDWLAFGAVYQSATKSHLSGKYSFKYSDRWQKMTAWSGSTAIMQISSMVFDLPYEATSEQSGTATTNIEWPQMASVGVKLKPVKRLSLLADLHWAGWSSIKEDNFAFDQKIQLLQLAKFMGYPGGAYNMILKRDLKDTLNWSVGIEYQALDWLELRAGYENRTTSTVEQYYDLMYALPNMDYYGAGLGIKGSALGIKMLKDVDIDLAFGYMINKSYKVANNTSVNMNSTVLGSGLMNPYAGLNYEQEMATYIGSFNTTMPLEIVTDMVFGSIEAVNPFKRRASTKGLRTTEGAVESSPSPTAVDNNIQVEGQSYFTGDSD